MTAAFIFWSRCFPRTGRLLGWSPTRTEASLCVPLKNGNRSLPESFTRSYLNPILSRVRVSRFGTCFTSRVARQSRRFKGAPAGGWWGGSGRVVHDRIDSEKHRVVSNGGQFRR